MRTMKILPVLTIVMAALAFPASAGPLPSPPDEYRPHILFMSQAPLTVAPEPETSALRVVMPGQRPRTVFDGGRRQLVTGATWAPDGNRFAFSTKKVNEDGSLAGTPLYKAKLGTLERKMIRRFRSGNYHSPFWSPVNEIHLDGRTELVIIRPNGERLRTHVASPYEWSIGWSPDGEKFLYTYGTCGHCDPRTLNYRTYDPEETVHEVAYDVNYASWSPDSSAIAFTTGADLVIHDVGTGENTVLSSEAAASPYMLAWSPDGTRLAYVSSNAGSADVWVMDAMGESEPVRLTSSSAKDTFPAWSPDGEQIAFLRDRASDDTAQRDLYVMDADGTNVERLTYSKKSETAPVWQPLVDFGG